MRYNKYSEPRVGTIYLVKRIREDLTSYGMGWYIVIILVLMPEIGKKLGLTSVESVMYNAIRKFIKAELQRASRESEGFKPQSIQKI